MRTLTKRQQELVDFVNRFKKEHGYSPSFQEIGTEMVVSKQAISAILLRLQRAGAVNIAQGKSRSINVNVNYLA